MVVLALGAPPELAGAVRSLLAQDAPLEILVVNSGGGDAAGLLRRAGLAVPVEERAERLFAGGARNLGIARTNAPLVAFLASDCRALPGWAAERLRLHTAGHPAVASAMVPDRPRSLLAWGQHLALYAGRLPGLPAEGALRYGASYTRALLRQVGDFAEALSSGEDSDYLARLPLPPCWAPGVLTQHLTEPSLVAACRQFHARGRRHATWMRGAGRDEAAPSGVGQQLAWVRRQIAQGLPPAQQRLARRALPLTRLFLWCGARGRRAGARDPALP